MTNPYTNFDTWLTNASFAINNPTKFEEFYLTFEGFLANITQTGFLPDCLAYRTGFFIDKLNTQFCRPIINKEENDDIKLPIMRQYLDLFLKFSLYGIINYEKSAINLAITILGDGNKPFYQSTSRHSIYKSLCKKYVEYGAMKYINEKLSDTIQDLELFKLLITLVSILYIHDQKYNPTLYIKNTSHLMHQYLLKNNFTLNVEIFCNCIEEIRNALPIKHDIIILFISEFLPLITPFFSSQSFEQRLAAVKEVSILSTEEKFFKQIAIYFQENISLLENLQFRAEYASSIGNILSLIARLDACTEQTVLKIWEKKTYLHESEKKSFYEMFLQFGRFGKGPVLKTTIELIFSLEHDDQWFDLLDLLLMNMKDRKECSDYLNQIRIFLMKIIFGDLPFINSIQIEDDLNIIYSDESSQDKSARAKSSLLMMVTFGANESTFLMISTLLSHGNNNYVLHLLNNFLTDDTKIKISHGVILETLDKSIDLLVESSLSSEDVHSQGPSEEIKDFVLKLCKFNKDSLTIPQLEKIFSCYQVINYSENNHMSNFDDDNDVNELKTLNTQSTFPNFFKFLDSLAIEDSITPDHLEILLSRFHSNDRSFFKLIKHLVYKANDSNSQAAKVEHLPLNKEDLLWNFALTDSPQRLEFDKLLCQIYASNDGVELTDKEVIDAFLDKWQLYYNKQMNLKKGIIDETKPPVIMTNQESPQFYQNNQMIQVNQMYQINQMCQMNQMYQMNQMNQMYQIYQMNPMNQMNQNNQSETVSHETDLNVETSLPILIDILRLFIYTMECQSSLNFNYAHKYESEKIDVTIYWTDQSNIIHYTVPPSTTIGSIIENICNEKNIKISTPVLTPHNLPQDKPIKRTQNIGIFAEMQPNGKKESMFNIRYDKSRKVKLHKRNARVSTEVINSLYIDDIFTILLYEENDKSSYELFKLLPQYKKAPDFKTMDAEDPNIDLKTIFPFDHMCLLLYNMISLLIDTSEDLNIARKWIENKNLDSYLIDAIEYFIINKEYKTLDELSLELVNYFLDFFALVPLQDDKNKIKDIQQRCERLFVVLIKLSLNPSLFQMVKKVCNFQFSIPLSKTLRMPFPENFEDVFKHMILNNEKKIRDFAVSQFERMNIPVHVFTDCLSEMGYSVSEEFLSCLTSHLSGGIIQEPKFYQLVLKLLYSESSHGTFFATLLTLVLNILQRQILNKSELPHLLDFLINRFITTKCNKDDLIAFQTASKCLVLLSSEMSFKLRDILETLNNKRKKPFNRFQIDGDQIEIAECNKVGLKNLGMTCYLNATIQQFYSIKPFRYAVMSYQGQNEFLKQLAILFQNMKYYKTKSVTTQGFVDNFSFMGEKLNPHKQQDATEFIQSFFDLIQIDPSYKNLVDELFKVVITNTKRGLDKDSDYINETNEPSYVFELEVKDLHSMVEGFEHFIKPNYLTGQNMYRVSRDTFINAVNHSVLSRIPPFLIIQLMRFEFIQKVYERQKISQRYEVLKEINIAKYTEIKDQEAVYSLTGIIIHRGNALGGHYISFVKSKKNGWLCFDDESATEISESEVMQQASGIEQSNIAGYILFYRRENYFNIPCIDLKHQYVLPESRKIEIDTLNEENIQQQLVCSSGYFELMKGLANLINDDYLLVCLKYSINTLPYAKEAENSKEVYNILARKVKNIQVNVDDAQYPNSIGHHIILYLSSNGFLSSSLFECTIECVRKGIVKLIKSCFIPSEKLINDNNFISFLVDFANKVFSLVPNCLFTYQNIDQLFNVLSYFVRKFPVIKSIAENEWNEDIRNLFVVGISAFFNAKPNLRSDYVFKGMNLTHFIKFVCNINLSNGNENDKIFSDSFYYDVLSSATKPKAISLFTDCYFSRDQFVSLLQKQELINEDCYKLFTLIFHIVPDRAVQLAMTCQFKKISFPCKDQDIITLMAATICMFPQTAEIVVKSCNEWMPFFLSDDDYIARNNAVVCALYTVPSQTITKHGLLDLDIPQYISLPVEMEIKTRPIDDEIINRSQILLKCALEVVAPYLTNIILEKAKKSKSKSKNIDNFDDTFSSNRACQFFQLINELLLIVPKSSLNQIPFKWIIELYLSICKTDTELFSEQMSTALAVINNFNIPLSFDNFMLCLGINTNTEGNKKQTSKSKNYANLHNFLPHFISILKSRFASIVLPEEFINFFFDNIAFAPIGKVAKSFDLIKIFVSDLCKLIPAKINNVLMSKKMKKWETNNICMIIAICEFMNKKRILLPIVSQTFKEIVKAGIDVNDLVMRAINQSLKNAYNNQIIEKLCEENKLNGKVKGALRDLLL